MPITQVAPFDSQASSHTQPPASHTQPVGWQVVGSGSTVHTKPSGHPVFVQFMGFGSPLHVKTEGRQVLPFMPQSSVHCQPLSPQKQLDA